MTPELLILFGLDLGVFVMFLVFLRNSRQVVVETKVGKKWLIPVAFLAVGVIGLKRYPAPFSYVQCFALVGLGLMYYKMKSGLSQRGIVMMGSLMKYEKIKEITLSWKDNCIFFEHQRRQLALFFREEQYDDVLAFLKKRAITTKKVH